MSAVSLRSPELKAGWPQQVWFSGTSTAQPGVFQELHRGETDRGPEEVDEAGHEKADTRPGQLHAVHPELIRQVLWRGATLPRKHLYDK